MLAIRANEVNNNRDNRYQWLSMLSNAEAEAERRKIQSKSCEKIPANFLNIDVHPGHFQKDFGKGRCDSEGLQ